MESLNIVSAEAENIEIPLVRPFVTSKGQAIRAQTVRVRLGLENGFEAIGESVPVEYVTEETTESVLAAIHALRSQLIGQDVLRWKSLFSRLQTLLPNAPSARCGLEMAVLDAWTHHSGMNLHKLLGGALQSIETDVTLSILPEAVEIATDLYEDGMRIFKMKVGGESLEEDFARILSVCDAAPDALIRVDANQAFSAEGALRFADRLVANGVPLQLLEQPVHKEDITGLGWVAARSPVPVFADESVQKPEDALRIAMTPVQGFNLKINKCGIQGVLDIIPIAKAAGRRLMIGCMLETRRSIAVSLAIACGTGAFEFCDLDGHLLLQEDGINTYFRHQASTLTINEEA